MALNHSGTEVIGARLIETFGPEIVALYETSIRFGAHRLAGVTEIEGVPGQTRVMAINRYNDTVVADIITATDGRWEINHIPHGEYTVTVLDLNRALNAEIADMVRAVPMPTGG